MKTKTLGADRLNAVVIDSTLHHVTDDLAALEAPILRQASTEIEALARFRGKLPSLLKIHGRGQAHAVQVRRLIAGLAGEPDVVDDWIDVANGLTILANASNLALLLLPASSEDDVWAVDQFGRQLLGHAHSNAESQDIALAQRAVSRLEKRAVDRTFPADAAGISTMIETMARRAGAMHPKPKPATDDMPSIHPLEHAESLKAFFTNAPDLMSIFGSARTLLAQADVHAASNLSPAIVTAAVEGALILSYARLLRVALWPARDERDLAAKIAARNLVRSRDADPDRLGALWEIAFAQGETIAGQSTRFLNIDERG